MRLRFRRRPDQAVTAIPLRLDFDGFDYRKWGAVQHAKAGDWLVDNDGDIYTVDADSFARTYRSAGPGRWLKTAPVWAEQVQAAGSVATREGRTHYAAGDWLVSNAEDGSDSYAIGHTKFLQLYEPDTGEDQATGQSPDREG